MVGRHIAMVTIISSESVTSARVFILSSFFVKVMSFSHAQPLFIDEIKTGLQG